MGNSYLKIFVFQRLNAVNRVVDFGSYRSKLGRYKVGHGASAHVTLFVCYKTAQFSYGTVKGMEEPVNYKKQAYK